MSRTQEPPPSGSEPYARRDELARLAGEVETMEARVNGRTSAESASIDGEVKTQGAEHRAQFGAVLEAIKALGQSMDQKMEAMQVEISLEIKIVEERHRGEMRVMKWGIGLLLAFAVPTFVRVFSPQLSVPLFGN